MNRAIRFKQAVTGIDGKIRWYPWGFVSPGKFEPPILSDGGYEAARANSMQATGLPAENQQELYEGDICELGIQTVIGIVRATAVMIWSNEETRFRLDIPTKYDMRAIEASGPVGLPRVIGNLIDTPELIPKTDAILGI